MDAFLDAVEGTATVFPNGADGLASLCSPMRRPVGAEREASQTWLSEMPAGWFSHQRQHCRHCEDLALPGSQVGDLLVDRSDQIAAEVSWTLTFNVESIFCTLPWIA